MKFSLRKPQSKKNRITRGVVPVRPVARPSSDTGNTAEEDKKKDAAKDTSPFSRKRKTGLSPMERFRGTRIFAFLSSKRLHFTLAGILFVALSVWGVWQAYHYLHHSPNFGLKHVEISPTFHVDRETLLSMAGLEYGRNIFSISPSDVRRRILSHPWVRSVSVTRKLPDTLRIEVTEHEAEAVAAFEEKTDCTQGPACPKPAMAFYLVDADADIFKRATPEEMRQKVIISGIPRDSIGKNPLSVKRLLRRSMDLLALWRENPDRPELGEIQVADDIFILVLRRIPCEIHLEISDARRRLDMLDALWNQLDPPLEKTRVIYLDDRENPGRIVVIPDEPSSDATPVEPQSPPQ